MAITNAPEGLFYTQKHEWVRIEGDYATIGITDYAQSSLGDIVFVDLPKLGLKILQFDAFGTVESVKAAEDISAPLSGEVFEVNESLNDNPALINEDAFENWIIKIKNYSKDELSNLLDANNYKEFVEPLD